MSRRCTVCRRTGHMARAHAHLEPEALAALRQDGLDYMGRGFRELGQPHPNGDLLDLAQAQAERAAGGDRVIGGEGPVIPQPVDLLGALQASVDRARAGRTVVSPVVSATPDENPQPDDVAPVTDDRCPDCRSMDPDLCCLGQPDGRPVETINLPEPGAVERGERVIEGSDGPELFVQFDNRSGRFWPHGEHGPQFVPWRTLLGPDEPIRVTRPGVYQLTADEYHSTEITGDWISNSDVKALLKTCPAQFKYDRDNKIRKVTQAFDFGHVAHTRVLGKGEAYEVFEPKKLDGRTVEGKAQKLAVDAARAAGRTPIYGDDWALITDMVEALKANPTASKLLAQPGRPEQCLFWYQQVKVTDPKNQLFGQTVLVRRRAMVDHLPDMPADGSWCTVVDYKTADEVNPNDDMRRKIYDYGYHRQAATIRAGLLALFDVDSEVVFLMQCKRPPHLVVPVDLDTPALRVAEAENNAVLQVWAECVATGEWPEYTKGVATSGVPAWIERQYEEDVY